MVSEQQSARQVRGVKSRRSISPMRLLAAAAMVIAICATGTARTPRSIAAPASAASGTLTIATAEPPQTFDPIQSPNSTVDQMALNNYDTLFQFTSTQHTQLRPSLAKSWSVSANGRVYTFTLRPRVRFHNGTKLTASDVKFTLDRIKKLNTGISSEMGPYSFSRVLNPGRIRVVLAKPYAPFRGALSRVYILNATLVRRHLGKDFAQTWLGNNDAGSGPYVLQKYTPNQTAVFKAFPSYWRGWAGHHSKTIVYNFIAEAATQRAAIQNGSADIAMNIAKPDLPSFTNKAKFKVIASNTLVQYYIFFNTANGPTKNKLVRQALAMAYDYSTHVKQILAGYGKLARGPLPLGMQCQAPNVYQPRFDLNKAKQLLQKAGYSNLTVSMEYLPVLEEEKKSFELFQSTLRSIGVTLKPIATTFPGYMGMLKSPKTTPDLGAVYAFPFFPDPNEVMYINFDSQFISNGYNYGNYKNPQVDQLVRRAQQLTNLNRRCVLYKQAQRLVANDVVEINVSDPQYTTVVSGKVRGYAYNPAHHQTENTYSIWVAGR